MILAASDIALQVIGHNGQPEYPGIEVLLPDSYMYVGAKAHQEMEACQFLITDRLQQSYIITTAALRRSGLQTDRERPPDKPRLQADQQRALQQLSECEDLNGWIRETEEPNSQVHATRFIDVPWTKLTRVQKQTTTIKGHST